MGGDVETLPHTATSSLSHLVNHLTTSSPSTARSPTYLSDSDDSDSDLYQSNAVFVKSHIVHKTPSKEAVPSTPSSGGDVAATAEPKEYQLFTGKHLGARYPSSSIPVETIDDDSSSSSSDDSDVEELSQPPLAQRSKPSAGKPSALAFSQPMVSSRQPQPVAPQLASTQVSTVSISELDAEEYAEGELETVVDDLDMLYEAEATAAEAELELAADIEEGMEEELSEIYETAAAQPAANVVSIDDAVADVDEDDTNPSPQASPRLSRKRSFDSADDSNAKRPRVTVLSESDDEVTETKMYVTDASRASRQTQQPDDHLDVSSSDDDDYSHLPRLAASAYKPAVAKTNLTEALLATSSDEDEPEEDADSADEEKSVHEADHSSDASSASESSRDDSPEPKYVCSSAEEVSDHQSNDSSSDSDDSSDHQGHSDSNDSSSSSEEPTTTISATSAIRKWWNKQAQRRDELAEQFSGEMDVEYEREVLQPVHEEYQRWLAENNEEEDELEARSAAFRAANYGVSASEADSDDYKSDSDSDVVNHSDDSVENKPSPSDSQAVVELENDPVEQRVAHPAHLAPQQADDATQLRDYLVHELQQQSPALAQHSLVQAPVQQPRGLLVKAAQAGLTACKAVGGLVGAWAIGNVVHQTLRQMKYVS